jgi:hypothetical protein
MLTVQMLLKNNSSEWPECATCYTAMHVYIMAYRESTWVWKNKRCRTVCQPYRNQTHRKGLNYGGQMHENLNPYHLSTGLQSLDRFPGVWIFFKLWTVFPLYLVLEFSSFCFCFTVFAALLTTSDYILSHNYKWWHHWMLVGHARATPAIAPKSSPYFSEYGLSLLSEAIIFSTNSSNSPLLTLWQWVPLVSCYNFFSIFSPTIFTYLSPLAFLPPDAPPLSVS